MWRCESVTYGHLKLCLHSFVQVNVFSIKNKKFKLEKNLLNIFDRAQIINAFLLEN